MSSIPPAVHPKKEKKNHKQNAKTVTHVHDILKENIWNLVSSWKWLGIKKEIKTQLDKSPDLWWLMVCLQLAELKQEAHELEMMLKWDVTSLKSAGFSFGNCFPPYMIVLILRADYKFLLDMNNSP